MWQKYYRVKTENALDSRGSSATDKRISDLKLGALIDGVSTIVERISSTLPETNKNT